MRDTNQLATAIVLALAFAGASGAAVAQTTPNNGENAPQLQLPGGLGTTELVPPPWLIDYTIGIGVEHTDNVTLSHSDQISQDLLTPTLGFSVDNSGSRLQAHVDGQIQYLDFLQGQYVNELRGQVTGAANWIVIPQRLSFAVADVSGVQPVQTRVEFAPDNLQQVNVFSAGPMLQFRLGNAMRGQAELQYTNTLASKTKYFDSDRGHVALRLIRDLDPTSQLSFNAVATHVDPQETDIFANEFAAPAYTNYQIYGRYQSTLANLKIDARAGWANYRFSQGVHSRNGAFGSVGANWQVTARNTLGVGVAHQFGDAASEFATEPTVPGAMPNITNILASGFGVGSSIVTSQVYEQNQANLSYQYTGERFQFSASPYISRQHYFNDTTLDIEYRGANAEVTYFINPLLKLGFTAEFDNIRYLTTGGHDTYTGFGPSLTQTLTPHWSWAVSLMRNNRRGESADRGYTENVVYMTLLYRR